MSNRLLKRKILSQARMQLAMQGISEEPCQDFLFVAIEQCQENVLSIQQAAHWMAEDTKAAIGA